MLGGGLAAVNAGVNKPDPDCYPCGTGISLQKETINRNKIMKNGGLQSEMERLEEKLKQLLSKDLREGSKRDRQIVFHKGKQRGSWTGACLAYSRNNRSVARAE